MNAKTLGDELHEEQAQAAYEREMKRHTSAIDDLLKELDDHYNDPLGMVADARTELAALRAENLQLSAGDYLLREIGAALNCAPDATILQRIKDAQVLISALIFYRDRNALNFQLEKADDYINALRDWLAANAPAEKESSGN